MTELRYEKYNNSDNVITIDLQNGYSVIAIIGTNENNTPIATLFLKDNTVDRWDLIEKAERIEFAITPNKIYSTLLEQVLQFLENGFFDYYIERTKYELNCFDKGNELIEKEKTF